MSTRSNILTIDQNTGKVRSIYCHWDGYIENNGKILFENYTWAKEVRALIDQGGISSLANTLEDTKFYIRDMKEPAINNKATEYEGLAEYFEQNESEFGYIEYVYVYSERYCRWAVLKTAESKNLRDLKSLKAALIEIELTNEVLKGLEFLGKPEPVYKVGDKVRYRMNSILSVIGYIVKLTDTHAVIKVDNDNFETCKISDIGGLEK